MCIYYIIIIISDSYLFSVSIFFLFYKSTSSLILLNGGGATFGCGNTMVIRGATGELGAHELVAVDEVIRD